jgi:hypothetical protein
MSDAGPAPRLTGRSDAEEWEAALDALEARLVSHEAALGQGVAAGPFAVVPLPTTPLPDRERVRAHVALSRVRALEAQTRRMLATRPVKHSPYS